MLESLPLRRKAAEIAHYTEKRRVNDSALVPFAHQPSSLRCLYVLDEEEDKFQDEPSAILLSPRAAFMKLVASAFNLDIRDRTRLEQQFVAIADLSTSVPCLHLQYPRDFAALPALRRLIVEREMGNVV